MQLSTCAGLSAVLTRMLCWPIVASTANVRWLGSDAVTAPDLAREFLLEVNQRVC
jgi:hypothetical protein